MKEFRETERNSVYVVVNLLSTRFTSEAVAMVTALCRPLRQAEDHPVRYD